MSFSSVREFSSKVWWLVLPKGGRCSFTYARKLLLKREEEEEEEGGTAKKNPAVWRTAL